MSDAADSRPLLLDVAGGAPGIHVTLEACGQHHVGVADVAGEAGPAALAAAGAQAALDALEQATPGAVGLRLDWSEVREPEGGLPALVIVVVTATIAGVPLQASGSVLLRDRPEWAGARAVLQALNRRLEIMSL